MTGRTLTGDNRGTISERPGYQLVGVAGSNPAEGNFAASQQIPARLVSFQMQKPDTGTRNVVVLLIALSLSASIHLIGKVREMARGPTEVVESYYAGNQFNGTLLEITDSRYVESYRSLNEFEPRIVSSGWYDKTNTRVTLQDDQTGETRVLFQFEDCLDFCTPTSGAVVCYSKTQLSWNDLLSEDVFRYSVDGVRLGDSLEEVADAWGEVITIPLGIAQFQRRVNPEQRVSLDRFGNVDFITGYRVLEDNTRLLSVGDEFQRALEIGSERKYQWPLVGISITGRAERIVGEVAICALSPSEELEYKSPSTERKTTALGLGQVNALTLSYASHKSK